MLHHRIDGGEAAVEVEFGIAEGFEILGAGDEYPVVISDDRWIAREVLSRPMRRGEDGFVIVEGLELRAVFAGGEKNAVFAVVAEV